MSVLPCQPPSVTDLLKLDDLVSKTTPQVPKTSHLLEKIFELCRTDWIANFLFTEDPIHLTLLTSASLFNTSFVSEIATTRVESPTSQPDPYSTFDKSHHTYSRLLIMPTFTAGHLTVGVGVMDFLNTAELLSLHTNQGSPSCYNYRFVRDAKQRKFLHVLDMPKEDIISVYSSVQESSTFCHSAIVQFRRSDMLRSIHDAKTSLIPSATSALLAVIEENYYRTCPVCGRHHAAKCGCSLTNIPPAHPFDFHRFKAELRKDFGTFEGLARRSQSFSSGGKATTSFGARVCLQVIDDNALKQRLRAWSICRHLNIFGEDPRQSFSLRPSEEQASVPVETDCVIDNLFSASNSIFGAGHCENVQGAASDNFQNSTDHPIFMDGPQGMEVVEMPSTLAAETSPAEAVYNRGNIKGFLNDYSALSGDREHVDCDDWWNHFNVAVVPDATDTCIPPPQISPEDLASNVPSGFPGNFKNAADPAALIQQSATTVKDVDSVALERRRKLEARKERNRASARRSNNKNKELRAAMRKELKVLVDKIEVLREHELKLRHENLALRKWSSEQKGT